MAATFSVRFVNEDGVESTKSGIKAGTKVSSLVGANSTCLINGQQVTHDAELRSGDVVEAIRKSGKGAS